MKGIAIFAVILSITLVAWLRFGPTSAPSVGPPLPEHEIAATVLQHLMHNNASGTQGNQLSKWGTIYVSVQPALLDDLSEGYDRFNQTATPSDEVMYLLRDLRLPLQVAPNGHSFLSLANPGVDNAIVFAIAAIVSESEDKVIVHAKYYLHPTNAGGYEYTLIRQEGKWTIEKALGMWVS